MLLSLFLYKLALAFNRVQEAVVDRHRITLYHELMLPALQGQALALSPGEQKLMSNWQNDHCSDGEEASQVVWRPWSSTGSQHHGAFANDWALVEGQAEWTPNDLPLPGYCIHPQYGNTWTTTLSIDLLPRLSFICHDIWGCIGMFKPASLQIFWAYQYYSTTSVILSTNVFINFITICQKERNYWQEPTTVTARLVSDGCDAYQHHTRHGISWGP